MTKRSPEIDCTKNTGNEKLCPVRALEHYLEKVEIVRRKLDEVFILLKDPSSPARTRHKHRAKQKEQNRRFQ